MPQSSFLLNLCYTRWKIYKLLSPLIFERMYLQLPKWCQHIRKCVCIIQRNPQSAPTGEMRSLAILSQKLLEIWNKVNQKIIQCRSLSVKGHSICINSIKRKRKVRILIFSSVSIHITQLISWQRKTIWEERNDNQTNWLK